MRKARARRTATRSILDDVTLSFLPGAKIGVVGPNGAGKSSVLRIMAGVDQPSNGDATLLARLHASGILEQEPHLDETKTVLENVQDGVAETKAHGRPLQRDLRRAGRPRRRLRHAARRDGQRCRSRSTTGRRGTSTPSSSRRWTPCAARRPTPTCRPVRRREAPGRAVQAAAAGARPAAARRADQPPRRRVACSGSSSTSRSTPAPSSRSPTTGTSSTTSPSGSSSSTAAAPTRTRATTRPTWRPSRRGSRSRGRRTPSAQKRLSDELEWVRSNAKGRQTKSQARLAALRGDGRRGRQDPQARLRGDPDPARPAAGQRRRRGRRT